ncbi:hypothetical protein GRJ22_14200 [Photobacterium carnosum]|uniref:hypothetical protein n=1 Tax=Photobacterium carnosum TaxID=2023717 RepID=UPI001E3D127C|nr:hypothetical protein [Photobacterium carnosum]MCD9557573.1 hypothetical protein [Photobacterium carnosum]
MIDGKYQIYSGIIWDIPNFLVCVILILVLSDKYKIPAYQQLLLFVHALLPFCLNDVLFPATLFGDQIRYVFSVHEIRSLFEATDPANTVVNASWMLSVLPLPFIETIKSLGFFNSFIYIVIFFFLKSKNILTNTSIVFYLCYPSLALYSGLSLRDTLILLFMIVGAYSAVERKYVLFIVVMILLYSIKFQNFLIMLPMVFYSIFNIRYKGISFKVAFVIVIIIYSVLIISYPISVPLINKYRMAMYIEDGGSATDNIKMISGIYDFIITGFSSGFYFLLKPFPWESNSFLQIFQSIENIVIVIFMIKITITSFKYDPKQVIFWVFFLMLSMSIYGLVVFNFGTAARYRYPFIVIYAIFLEYTCKKVRHEK